MQSAHRRFVGSLFVAGFLAAPLAAHAQSSELRDLSGFDAVQTNNGIDLNVTQGETFRVEVVASPANLPKILTEVEDATLVIRLDRGGRGGLGWFGGAIVNVTLPVVHELSASGGSDLSSAGVLTGDSLTVSASGGSDVRLEIALDSLESSVSGGSDMRLTGTVDVLRTQASGGSDLDARRLNANHAVIASSGGSDTMITVAESLDVTASGGSDVVYFGNPADVSVNASGGSDVVSRNEGESGLTRGIRELFGN